MQDMGVGTRRQLSKHRGSASLEPAQQGQQVKRAEGYRERGHISQPKASALRVQPTRPPFASISAGRPSNNPSQAADRVRPAIHTPEDTGHEADMGAQEGTVLQEEQRSEQSMITAPGQGVRAGPRLDVDSTGEKAQHLLPSFHGPSFKGQTSAPGAALQPLTADKSSALQESQQELAERLGLVRPADSFARALGPRPHFRSPHSSSSTGHSLSGAGDGSHNHISNSTSSLQEGSAVAHPAQNGQASTKDSTKRKRQVDERPQVLEVSGAEAQRDVPNKGRGRDRSQVSWLRPPGGASRALQVTKDGPKDAMRHSQGLKVLLDDDARAKEADLMQKEAADTADTAESMAQSAAADPMQQPKEAVDSSAMSPASIEQPAKVPQSSEGLHDRSQTESNIGSKPAVSSRIQDLQHLPGAESTASENGGAHGGRRWRLRGPLRQSARSALSKGRLTEQVRGMHFCLRYHGLRHCMYGFCLS